jgi:hypothetical protein
MSPEKAAPGRKRVWSAILAAAMVMAAPAVCHGAGKQDKPDRPAAASGETGRHGKAAAPGVRMWIARALFNKGAVLWQQGKTREAIAIFEEIVRRFGKDAAPAVREIVAKARVAKARAIKTQSRR